MKINDNEALDFLIKNDKLDWLLTGKFGAKLNLPNGDIQNLEPQDFGTAIKIVYRLYKENKYENIDKMYETKLLMMSLDQKDLMNLYAAMNIIVYQLMYERDKISPFKLKHTKQILENLKINIEKNKHRLENNMMWSGILYKDKGLWGTVENNNKWLADNDYDEIITRQR